MSRSSQASSQGDGSVHLDCSPQQATDDSAQFGSVRRPSLLTSACGAAAARLAEDWLFLALLGLLVAALSFAMDLGIDLCLQGRAWLLATCPPHVSTRLLAWLAPPLALLLAAVTFVRVVAPQSVGSGIPEMKTILRGGVVAEVLTFRTLVAKVVGLTATLGSGLPLGKEGALIHISSIVAALLSRLVTSRRPAYENESRRCEMLAAACAVGVATCFAAPIGGVLFSIEVTTVYFAVRNYWRGFFAAVCGATVFRLLAVWCEQEDTLVPIFATNFAIDFPFDPQELFVFALIGAACGLGGSLYVWLHRTYLKVIRRSERVNDLMRKHKLLYPGVICLLVTFFSSPTALGGLMASDLNTGSQVKGLFANFSWTSDNLTAAQGEVVSHWAPPGGNLFLSLALFLGYNFGFGLLCSTIPVPSGSFIPVFKVGAALGRGVGEAMALAFPAGLRYGRIVAPIIPGSYATVGAAAFSGAVTHTISVSVIVFEMTGQITHTVPIMVAVLVSNGVASLLQPSLYDSIIRLRQLPYLPRIDPANSGASRVFVEDFMSRATTFLWQGLSYLQLRDILEQHKTLRSFPLVQDPESKVLLGSVRRRDLMALVRSRLGTWCVTSAVRRVAPKVASASRLAPPSSMPGLQGHGGHVLMPKSASFTLPGSPPSTEAWFHTLPRAARVRRAIQAAFGRSETLQEKSDNEAKVCEPDVTSQQRASWEAVQLAGVAELSACCTDPAPFQLVQRTSLLKVHSLFCLLALQRAYVTHLGRLVGVVTLAQLRTAIQDSNAGRLLPRRSVDSRVTDPCEEVKVTTKL